MPKIPYEEKYSGFSVSHLVKHVQNEYLSLTNPQAKKKNSQKRFLERLSTLNEVQMYLLERLKILDRQHCSFFPIESFVEYNDFIAVKLQTIKERAQVIGHDMENNKVLVKFDKKPEEVVAVSPLKLKLLYIKDYRV